MDENVLLGVGKHTMPLSPAMWRRHLSVGADLSFMSEVHHRVRNFVVIEIARTGKPLSPEDISEKLVIPLDEVISLLDDLEKHMTFLFRGDGNNVTWAYPVTTEVTPHRVTSSSGESIHAA